jgi:hypothetical protein
MLITKKILVPDGQRLVNAPKNFFFQNRLFMPFTIFVDKIQAIVILNNELSKLS